MIGQSALDPRSDAARSIETLWWWWMLAVACVVIGGALVLLLIAWGRRRRRRPGYAPRSLGLMFAVAAALFALGGLVQIERVRAAAEAEAS